MSIRFILSFLSCRTGADRRESTAGGPKLRFAALHAERVRVNTAAPDDAPMSFGTLRQNIASETLFCEKNGKGTGKIPVP